MTELTLLAFDRDNPPQEFVDLRDTVTDTIEFLERLRGVLAQVSTVDTDAVRMTAEWLVLRSAVLTSHADALDVALRAATDDRTEGGDAA